jgi:hypothetical protein
LSLGIAGLASIRPFRIVESVGGAIGCVPTILDSGHLAAAGVDSRRLLGVIGMTGG